MCFFAFSLELRERLHVYHKRCPHIGNTVKFDFGSALFHLCERRRCVFRLRLLRTEYMFHTNKAHMLIFLLCVLLTTCVSFVQKEGRSHD